VLYDEMRKRDPEIHKALAPAMSLKSVLSGALECLHRTEYHSRVRVPLALMSYQPSEALRSGVLDRAPGAELRLESEEPLERE
jgi:hypothetical protein